MSSKLGSEAPREGTVGGMLSRSFAKRKPLPAGTRLDGQTAVVTGSNTGLGLEACRQLLKLGVSKLIMGVRTQAKGDAAAAQLRSEFSSPSISVWAVDMESYDSVRQFAQRLAELPRIHIVILNAAGVKTAFTTVSPDGNETNLQVNYLSTALLAILLLPILKSKKDPAAPRPPVLSIVGSDTMYNADYWPKLQGPTFKPYNKPEHFSYMPWYGASKLFVCFFVSRLVEFVNPSDVLINIPNPGPTRNTGLARDAPRIVQIVLSIAQHLLGRNTEQGASIYMHAALGIGEESHGSFVSDWAIRPYPACWYTDEGRDFSNRLWEETMEELNFADASAIVRGLEPSSH
jgi:NAD(P)-dependent dehydrogenase (short-subunit alcohol dehydrogenase family)